MGAWRMSECMNCGKEIKYENGDDEEQGICKKCMPSSAEIREWLKDYNGYFEAKEWKKKTKAVIIVIGLIKYMKIV